MHVSYRYFFYSVMLKLLLYRDCALYTVKDSGEWTGITYYRQHQCLLQVSHNRHTEKMAGFMIVAMSVNVSKLRELRFVLNN